MQGKKTIIILLSGALVVAIGFGAIAYRSVFAATPTIESTGTTVQAEFGLGKGPMGGFTKQDLADALGISMDKLTAAYQQAYSAMLAEAVSQDLITQSQADQLSQNGKVFPFGERWGGWLTQNGIDFNTYLADALDISVEELISGYQTAVFTRIDQAVTDGKLTEEQADLMKGHYALFNDGTFQSSMQSAFKDAVNAAVTSGVITQSQADQILSKGANFFGGGLGGWPGHRGPRGMGGGWMNPGGLELEP